MYSPEFEQCWAVYPRKIGKLSAWKAFSKAIKNGANYEEIGNGVIEYSKHLTANRTEQRFILHFATFINQQRYLDDYATERANQRRKSDTGLSMVAAIEVVSQNQPQGSLERCRNVNGDEDIFKLPSTR